MLKINSTYEITFKDEEGGHLTETGKLIEIETDTMYDEDGITIVDENGFESNILFSNIIKYLQK